MRLGADARSVDVTVEIDRQTHRVRAIAMGAAEMHVKDPGGSIAEREARGIAARSMGLAVESLRLAAATSGMRIYQAPGEGIGPVRAVDWEGAIRVRRSAALVRDAHAANARQALQQLWADTAGNDGSRTAVPGLFLMYRAASHRPVGGRDTGAGIGAGGERAGWPGRRCAGGADRRATGAGGLA